MTWSNVTCCGALSPQRQKLSFKNCNASVVQHCHWALFCKSFRINALWCSYGVICSCWCPLQVFWSQAKTKLPTADYFWTRQFASMPQARQWHVWNTKMRLLNVSYYLPRTPFNCMRLLCNWDVGKPMCLLCGIWTSLANIIHTIKSVC